MGEALDAVGGRDVAEACAPECECVDERLAEDDFLRGDEGLDVEDAAVRAGEVEMERRAGAQLVSWRDLPAVGAEGLAPLAEDRDDERAVEVLVAAVPEDSELLEPCADLLAGLAVHGGEAVAEGPVGVAEPEAVDEFGMDEASLLEIAECLRALLQRLVVVADHLAEKLAVVGVEVDGRRQLRDGRALRGVERGRRREVLGPQDLDGVPEAHPFGLHHPVDRRAARLTSPEAVPEVLAGSHDEGRLAVVVEGTAADQIRPVAPELDAPRLSEALERDLLTDAPEQLVGDSRHRSPPPGPA